MYNFMPDLTTAAGWMPVVFLLVMGLAMLAYVVLDGYDLGVGALFLMAQDEEKDLMIASIGPFWDANETWLVLGVGILLTVFPLAHGVILGALYLPVALMLVGLTARGVAFEFRVKARPEHKQLWNFAFFWGSLVAGWAQGFMLGSLITGFRDDWGSNLFSVLIGVALVAGYSLLGAGWVIMKCEGPLQRKAILWGKASLGLTALGIASISIATPLVSETIFNKWFSFPYFVLLLPIPLASLTLLWVIRRSLDRMPHRLESNNQYGSGIPFGATVGLFFLCAYGLAYSLFPWLVVDRIHIWQGAVSEASMQVIFVGAVLVLPLIVTYTVMTYRVFRGKASTLTY
ncbi:MAG: cytochrome d ubiquinol oxidase subunit II [Betaproteobacteria bacterium]|mgnify:CR=1 FL=1|nr:cytochrome d ubiquinol oxidase subunit II [Betaproteobacteria bacterium]NCA16542.1 cytochrome d ubiquinol oxidase subunit II [Betaproteobacteria bacterium]